MRSTLVIALLGVCGMAAAQSYVVAPNAYANTAASASGLNTFIRDSGNPRTGQLLIRSTQLAAINVGDQITGITFRLWTGATANFPPNGATWSDYTINVGPGVDPLSATTTFATNFASAPTTVRSGALSIPANAFTFGGSPNAWGYEITFTTPYIYTGGNLTIEARHTGSNIVNTASDFLESVATSDALYTGGEIRSYTATGNTATTGALNTFTVARLTYSPVPEPASMAVLGLGALALLRRRRR